MVPLQKQESIFHNIRTMKKKLKRVSFIWEKTQKLLNLIYEHKKETTKAIIK